MQHSETIGKLSDALAKAQAEIKSIGKDSQGNVETKSGVKFKYTYASLGAILEAVRPVLAKHGLSIVQGASDTTNGFNVETWLVHSSGEYIANVVAVPVSKQDAQGVGSALTYGRRYGVSALLALSTDEDDDGEAAVKKPAPKAETKKAEPAKAEADADDHTPIGTKWDGSDADALDYTFPVVFKGHEGKKMRDIPDADLAAFVAKAGVKPKYIHLVNRANAILTFRQRQN